MSLKCTVLRKQQVGISGWQQSGGVGVAPGNFNGIAGLSVSDEFLLVTDSLNARMNIMLINPSALDVWK